MLIHPEINPVLLNLPGPLSVNWYGLSYLAAFVAFYLLARYRASVRGDISAEQLGDMLFYGALGVVIGGRLGYVLLYQFDLFLSNPLYLFRAWEGGMSFHGGFLGVLLAVAAYAYKTGRSWFALMDYIAPAVPLGLFFGRLANFINQELWGRVSDGGYSWLMGFPQAAALDAHLIASNASYYALAQLSQTQTGMMMLLPRHPSQLYEAFLEGIALFVLLWWFSAKPRPRMSVSALFLIGYGSARSFVELFRQPDLDQGFIAFGWITKGMAYSLPMIIIGLIMLYFAYRKPVYDWSVELPGRVKTR